MSRPVLGLRIAALLQVVALAVMATLPQWVEVLPTTTPNEQASAVVIGVALAQAALAALVMLPLASGFVRAAGGTILLAGAFLASVAYHRQADQDEDLLLTAQVIGAFLWIAGLEVLAVFGCPTPWGQHALRHPNVETTAQRPAQFHLWHLLAGMTAVGVLLALGRVAWGPLRSELELEPLQYLQMLFMMAMIASTCAFISIVTIATVLASRRSLALWCASILLVGFASAGEIYLLEFVGGPHAEAWHWRMNYSTFAWMTLSLLPVRLAGWRMTWSGA